MKILKPRKVKVIITFIDAPDAFDAGADYFPSRDLKKLIKDAIKDEGVRNLKIQVIKQMRKR